MKRNSNRGGNNSERQKSRIFHDSEGRGREGKGRRNCVQELNLVSNALRASA
jgi:hypothetical protein